MKLVRFVILFILASVGMILTGCDVHEYPDGGEEVKPTVPFAIHLRFDTNMPIYQDIHYLTTRLPDTEEPSDIRYIIQAYRSDNGTDFTRQPDYVFTFSQASSKGLDYDAVVNLEEGYYTFLVWADYVEKGTQVDYFHITSDFQEIKYTSKEGYKGNTDRRDAFRGCVEASKALLVTSRAEEAEREITIPMVRPLAKIKLIATDSTLFVRQMLLAQQKRNEAAGKGSSEESRAINPDDYRVVFRYSGFMPCSFNMYTNKPAASWSGVPFNGALTVLDDQSEAEMGFDYVFTNGVEARVSVSVEVYDQENTMVASINPIEVPLVRSKLTIVRGDFLTTKSTGGVGINPDFDGSFDIFIP